MNLIPEQSPSPGTPESDAIDLKIQEIQGRAKTLGEYLELCYTEVFLPNFPEHPLARDTKLGGRILRWCKPWPDWVLRIAAEVLHVRFSKIPKQSIVEALALLNFILLENKQAKWPEFENLDDKFLGCFYGHLYALFLQAETTWRQKWDSTPDSDKPRFPTQADLQKQFVPLFAELIFFRNPEGYLPFQDAFAEAKNGTFDKSGNLKETPLTPIYRRILANWPEIECLSGPKALTEYLSPLLGKQDFEDKYERVKQISSRFKIEYQPVVK